MQAVLDQLAALHPQPITQLTPPDARQQPTPAQAVKALLNKQGKPTQEPVADVQEQQIPGPNGAVAVRIYTPEGTAPFPVLVYFHGGGWVIADLDTYDASCRALCNAVGCIVASVAYRQAPEHPFPAAAEDAYASLQWALRDAERFNGDPRRVAIAGESAGGNLATVACLMARDRGTVMPVHQLLVYPVTNYAFDTPSYQENAEAKPLNAAMMRWFWGYYLPDASQGSNPYASPLQAQDLRGLPPATVITAEIDPLRDEGEAYARRLQDAGNPVVGTRYPGVTHEFFGMRAVLDQAKAAVEVASSQLRMAFGLTAPAAHGVSRAQVMPGAEVMGADGKKIGVVKAVRDRDFLVNRRMKRDVYVPFEAVGSADGQIMVTVPASDVDHHNWASPSIV